MPAMDEGAFVLDYFAPTRHAAGRTEEMAHSSRRSCPRTPTWMSTSAAPAPQMGLFATKTNRGDIQVVLRPAEDDLWSLLTNPFGPSSSEIEEELKAATARTAIRRKYRRRPMTEVMEEIEEEIKEHFTEHQLKTEADPDHAGPTERPVRRRTSRWRSSCSAPTTRELRPLAEEVAEILEKKGKGRGIEEVNSHVFAGNPDLMVQVDGVLGGAVGLTPQEVERQLRAMYLGQIATQVRESSPADHRCARPLSGRASLRPRPLRSRSASCSNRSCCRQASSAADACRRRCTPLPGPARDGAAVRRGHGRARAHARRAGAREPAAGRHRHRRAERGGGGPGLGRRRHPPLDGASSACRPATAGSWAGTTSSSRRPSAA